MHAFTAIARRRFARVEPAREEGLNLPLAPLNLHRASLGARPSASQRGATTRALFGGAPSTAETDRLRALAASAQGLQIDVVVITGSPFNSSVLRELDT